MDENKKYDYDELFHSGSNNSGKPVKRVQDIIENISSGGTGQTDDGIKKRFSVFPIIVIALFIMLFISVRLGKEQFTYIITCVLFGTVIFNFIVGSIIERVSLTAPRGEYEIKTGKVMSVEKSSTTSTGRSSSTVYRITLEVDGKKAVAYSRQRLSLGKEVTVYVSGKKRNIYHIAS